MILLVGAGSPCVREACPVRIHGKLCQLGSDEAFGSRLAGTIPIPSHHREVIVDIVTERITTADGVGGFLAYPKGQNSPAVLVHFEILGVNGHIEKVCKRIAEARP